VTLGLDEGWLGEIIDGWLDGSRVGSDEGL